MASSSRSIKVPVFEGKNFEHWRIHMENIFRYQEVWDIVDTGYVEPAANAVLTAEQTTALQESRKQKEKSTYILHQCVHESLFDRIVWKLQKSVIFFLKRTSEMKSNGDTIEDAAIVETILRSLPESFEAEVSAIEEYNSAATMSLDEILGHFQRGCPEKKFETRNNENFVEKQQYDFEVLLLACFTAQEQNKSKWYLDTGCSNHICGMEELFVDLDESVNTSVMFGNNEIVTVMGRAKIGIILKNEAYSCILDVYYVLGLYKNLLSMGQLVERGYSMNISDGVCSIRDTRKKLFAKEMVSGLPPIDNPEKQCESCIFGKQHRDVFPVKKTKLAEQPLESIHSDLCGPTEEISRGGNK
ncbi:uncharacterized protein LOC113296086 [Papaver somniferum]|uniref:uncharacterized protein LOC113296086 n=1 Tax=Papaver somniferum TaxID=3469 RepID=UPI000E6FEBF5|nr:uncharacterized protein LOC113296086 [Papaver somniferum]